MDVESKTQVLETHHRAFDVPSRPSPPPGAVPAPIVGGGALPEREVERVPLQLVGLDPRTGDEVFDPPPAEFSVTSEAPDRKVNVALSVGTVESVRRSSIEQLTDERNNPREVVADTRLVGRAQAADRGDVRLVNGRHATG